MMFIVPTSSPFAMSVASKVCGWPKRHQEHAPGGSGPGAFVVNLLASPFPIYGYALLLARRPRNPGFPAAERLNGVPSNASSDRPGGVFERSARLPTRLPTGIQAETQARDADASFAARDVFVSWRGGTCGRRRTRLQTLSASACTTDRKANAK